MGVILYCKIPVKRKSELVHEVMKNLYDLFFIVRSSCIGRDLRDFPGSRSPEIWSQKSMVFTILHVLLTRDVKQCYIEANSERMGDIMIYRLLKVSGLVSGIFVVAAAALATDFLFNFQGSQVCVPGSYHQPTYINEVSSIVKKAYGLGIKVMTGSEKFASQIDAAFTDAGGVQISLAQIDHIHVLNK